MINSEKRLIQRLARDDHGALKEIFHSYFDVLMRKAYSYTRDKDSAEDIVQKVFISLWDHRYTLNIRSSLQSYLSGAVKNQSLTYLKKKFTASNETIDLFIPQLESSESTDQPLHTRELKTLLERMVASLPEKTQIVFLMSRKEEMTNQEIASHLDISIKTVEYHITRALKSLKEALIVSGYQLSVLVILVFRP